MTETIVKPIRVGSRKSELALIQTKYVISQLQNLYPEKCFEIHTMSTIGDRVLNVSLPKIGEKSLFTRDLEDALRNGGVDFVVHSLKDLPTALPPGMAIGAVLEREDSRDALVLNEKYKGHTIDTLPAGCVIGTSSLRRTAQIRRLYPHLEVCDIRGNLNTRLAKLDALNSKFSGIILAQAGLLRMGWMNRISQILEPNHLLYAVGQGALAVECRSNDENILNMLKNLMCLTTTCRIIAERSFLKTLGGGCSAPVAVSTEINEIIDDNEDNVRLDITGAVWSLDGNTEIKEDIDCYIKLDRKRKNTEIAIGNDLQNKENSDEDEKEESPRKRIKSDDDNDDTTNKQGSPKIVNDDKFIDNGSGDKPNEKVTDLEYLINIHGELFKKCPFYVQHQKDRENGNTSSKQDDCPLNIPIGQDFMGKCPYLDVPQKVELSEKYGNACPITGKFSIAENSNNNNLNVGQVNILGQGDIVISNNSSNKKNNLEISESNMLGQGDIGAIKQSKCPFSSIKTGEDVKDFTNTLNEKKIGHEICPFLQKNIKMIDYDDENLKNPKNELFTSQLPSQPILTDDSNELFCGLYRHNCYKHDLFSKCEQIGKDLAENLIKKGALEVMKCAQQEIREKS